MRRRISRPWRAVVPWLLSCAAVLSPLARAESREFGLLGPLRVRDLTPFDLLRLEMRPSLVVRTTTPGWALEFQHEHANTFTLSNNVAQYLNARGRRVPISTLEAGSTSR